MVRMGCYHVHLPPLRQDLHPEEYLGTFGILLMRTSPEGQACSSGISGLPCAMKAGLQQLALNATEIG